MIDTIINGYKSMHVKIVVLCFLVLKLFLSLLFLKKKINDMRAYILKLKACIHATEKLRVINKIHYLRNGPSF